jgi:hypothetical protein
MICLFAKMFALKSYLFFRQEWVGGRRFNLKRSNSALVTIGRYDFNEYEGCDNPLGN